MKYAGYTVVPFFAYRVLDDEVIFNLSGDFDKVFVSYFEYDNKVDMRYCGYSTSLLPTGPCIYLTNKSYYKRLVSIPCTVAKYVMEKGDGVIVKVYGSNDDLIGVNLDGWTITVEYDPELIKLIHGFLPKKFDLDDYKEYFQRPCFYETITIGCDIETELIKDGVIVSGLEEISTVKTSDGEVGLDGSGNQVELRPDCGGSIKELVKNINSLVEFCSDRLDDLSCQGDSFPIGFHIHFSTDDWVKRLAPTTDLLIILDNWLAEIFENHHGLARGKYKAKSAYRDNKFHGGWEYRSLPGSIMASPKLTSAVLKASYIIAYLYYSGFDIKSKPDYDNLVKEFTELGLDKESAEILYNVYRGEFKLKPSIIAAWGIKNPPSMRQSKYKIVYSGDVFSTEFTVQMADRFLDRLNKTIRVFGAAYGVVVNNRRNYDLIKEITDEIGVECRIKSNSNPIPSIGLPRKWRENPMEESMDAIEKIFKALNFID